MTSWTRRVREGAVLPLALVLLLAWVHARAPLYDAWTPSDEGVLAQSAERVMHGELPHRDFDALWSGGLDWLNAGAFRILGVRLATLRDVLLVAWLVGLAAMFDAARRFVSPWGAALAVWCAALWTLPLSPSPLPSWYNLFLALVGGAMVLRSISSPRRAAWLFGAGAAAGASIAVKVVGLYFVSAVLLSCVQRAQDAHVTPRATGPGLGRWYAWFVTIGLLAFLAMVVRLITYSPTVNSAVQFVLPSAVLVAVLLVREWRADGSTDAARFRELMSLAAPFAAGLAVVVGVWLAPYALSGSLGRLAHGLFVAPMVRFDVATSPLPGLRSTGVSVLPFLVLLAGAPFVRQPLGRADRLALAAAVGVYVLAAFDGSPEVLTTWYAFRILTPSVAALATWWWMRRGRATSGGMSDGLDSTTFFLVAAAATCSLVQIPYALYTYFLYVVPLLILAVAALLARTPGMPREISLALAVMAIAFRLREPQDIVRHDEPRPQDEMVFLGGERGGIRVTRGDSLRYARVLGEVARRATSDAIYVWHDSPEIYFLSGKRNPTRTLFETFADPATQTPAAIEEMLRSHGVGVVVLTPPSGEARVLAPELRAWIEREYPSVARVADVEIRSRR